MNHDKLKEFLTFSFEQRCEHGIAIAPIIWGTTGVGKTTTVREFADEIGAEITVLHLASQEPGDLIGLPSRSGDQTVWLKPDWFPEGENKKHVIFLDELNRAHKSVLDVMLPFLLEGELHTHKVPKNTFIVAAANPDDGENYEVTNIEDKAMLSRLCHVWLNANYKGWKKFCGETVHEAVFKAVEKVGDSFSEKIVLPDLCPDPRSLYVVGAALNNISDEHYGMFGYEFVQGMVGSKYASAIRNEIEASGLNSISFTFEDLLKDYPSKKKEVAKIAKENPVALTEICSQAWEKILGRRMFKKNWDNFVSLLKDVPDEIFASIYTPVATYFLEVESSKVDTAVKKAESFQEADDRNGGKIVERIKVMKKDIAEDKTVEQN